jgi:hypothetical protein
MWAASISTGGAALIAEPFPAVSITNTPTGTYNITFDSGAAAGRRISSANGIPFVSIGAAATADSITSRWEWTATYVLTIYIYRENGGSLTLVNAPFSVQVQGHYG